MVNTFISYSWDSDVHKEWVRELATRLRKDGVAVTLDQWHIIPGDQIPEFMERSVRESDYVLVICTQRYKTRSDSRQGGVGYEGDIMTAEVMNNQNQRKFIPVLREKRWNDSAPSWLSGKYYIDLSATPYSENQYQDLLTTLLDIRQEAPPVGDTVKTKARSISKSSNRKVSETKSFEPIKIIGVIVDQIGTPRNDRTRGSALYRVPFRLSRRPPREWAELFIHFWKNPPRYTTMHRSGIASVVNDTVILDGTTVEEVEKYHRDTLILVTKEANDKYQKYLEKKQTEEERERNRIEAHQRKVDEVSKRISFDDD
jgi:hypothetical protein